MTETTTALLQQALASLEVVVASDPQGVAEADAALIESTRLTEDVVRVAGILAARRAAEIAHRSRRELGRDGLAAVHGHVNAPSLVRNITRSGFPEASRRIRVGTVLNEAAAHAHAAGERIAGADFLGGARSMDGTGPTGGEASMAGGDSMSGVDLTAGAGSLFEAGPHPGLSRSAGARSFDLVADAIAGGLLGVEAADKVIRTLSPVVETVDPELLATATATLIMESGDVNADEVGAMARGVRDTLDRAGVADREAFLRSKRSLKRGSVTDGLRHVSLVLDPESDVLLMGAIDTLMSPRLGGPRFRDKDDNAAANQLLEDPRTNEQIALDLLVDLVAAGVNANPARMPGAAGPAVRVTMTADDLVRKVTEHAGAGTGPTEDTMHGSGEVTGVAMIDGHPELISASTARRYLCNQGALPVVLGGDSVPLDLGRTKRLFSSAQRIALAIRDRGCRWPECDRPPSWTESHHINEYQHGGRTDLKDGVALCRRHHLLLHNNGWQIIRRERPHERSREGSHEHSHEHSHGHNDPVFWLRPPATLDPTQTLIPAPAKGAPL